MVTSFSISHWCGWVQQISDTPATAATGTFCSESPDVAAIPAMLRRRLNLLGRAAASQIMQLLKAGDNAAIVYCSRHGDLERTLGVLEDLAKGEPVSPMNFSLTVHNAVPGVISIHSQLTSCISSIAAGNNGLIPTLLEAIGLLSDECPNVICMLCDVPLPEVFRAEDVPPDDIHTKDTLAGDNGPEHAFAACFVISRTEGTKMTLASTDSAAMHCSPATSASVPILFTEFLAGESSEITIDHNGGSWIILKQ